jgi:hypothetical protein
MAENYDLGNSYDISYNTRGGVNRGVCDWNQSKNGAPKFYKAKEGDDTPNKLVIVPYKIKSKAHPWVFQGKRKIGDLAYSLDIWTHYKVGPGEVSLVCPASNYGKACPLCEMAAKWNPPADNPKAKNPYKAQRRMYYNVLDMTDPDDGLKVFDVSHACFEKELIGAAQRKGTNGQSVHFADVDNATGRMVKCFGEKTNGGGFNYTKFKDFEFIERKVDIKLFIDKAIPFDELITLYSYDEIMAIIVGVDEEDSGADSEYGEPDTNAKDTPQPPKAEEDEDAVLEARRKAKAASKAEGANPCPSGYKFGVDWMEKTDCKLCKVDHSASFKGCMAESK